jgi:hypothetical protein
VIVLLESGHISWSHCRELESRAIEAKLYFRARDMESRDDSSQNPRNAKV